MNIKVFLWVTWIKASPIKKTEEDSFNFLVYFQLNLLSIHKQFCYIAIFFDRWLNWAWKWCWTTKMICKAFYDVYMTSRQLGFFARGCFGSRCINMCDSRVKTCYIQVIVYYGHLLKKDFLFPFTTEEFKYFLYYNYITPN